MIIICVSQRQSAWLINREKRGGPAMCKLQIYVQCHDRYFEVISDEVRSAEIAVEDSVGHVLLHLFDEGTVEVEDVTIHFSPGLRMGLQQCSIQIHAQCSFASFVLLPCTKENIERTVEESIRPILKELFGSVKVESVIFSLAPWEIGSDSAGLRKRFYSPS